MGYGSQLLSKTFVTFRDEAVVGPEGEETDAGSAVHSAAFIG